MKVQQSDVKVEAVKEGFRTLKVTIGDRLRQLNTLTPLQNICRDCEFNNSGQGFVRRTLFVFFVTTKWSTTSTFKKEKYHLGSCSYIPTSFKPTGNGSSVKEKGS